MTPEIPSFPTCQKCELGVMVPLSDDGPNGEDLVYKGWACTNPNCGFALKIRQGIIRQINILR